MTYQPQQRSDVIPDHWDVKRWHDAVAKNILGRTFASLNHIPIEAVFDGTLYTGDEDESR